MVNYWEKSLLKWAISVRDVRKINLSRKYTPNGSVSIKMAETYLEGCPRLLHGVFGGRGHQSSAVTEDSSQCFISTQGSSFSCQAQKIWGFVDEGLGRLACLGKQRDSLDRILMAGEAWNSSLPAVSITITKVESFVPYCLIWKRP